MIVKCPSCGQQVRGEPGQSGPCPKCWQRFMFPKENRHVGAIVVCPHCKQNQLLQQDGRCIKCRSIIRVYDRSEGRRILTPLYICPSCQHIQSGDSNRCEKCGADMRHKSGLSKVFTAIFSICLIYLIYTFITKLHDMIVNDGYISSLDKESLYANIFLIALVVVLLAVSIRFLVASPKKVEKIVELSYPFCNIDGIQGIKFESSGAMRFSEDKQQICFSIGENFSRSLDFSQVDCISFGRYNYDQLKSFVGGVSIGHVYVHESPVAHKSKPFFQIKYRSSDPRSTEGVIRVIFNDWQNIGDLEFITSWIGFEGDSSYMVEAHDKL